MEHYTKPRVNRYWKRPKPKVYDCNVRDAERFYQESYKTYLTEKEEGAARAARARSYEPTFQPDFYPHLVAGSIRRDTNARTNLDLPPLPPSLSEGTRARLEAELCPRPTDNETSFTARISGLPTHDSLKDASSLDERLDRLKKLREGLGLPPEPVGSTAHSLRSGSLGRSGGSGVGVNEDREVYKSERTTRARVDRTPEESGTTSSTYTMRSERSARMNGTAGPIDDLTTNDYKFRSDRNTDDLSGGVVSNSYSKYKSDLQMDDYKGGSSGGVGGRSFDLSSSRSERAQRNMSPPKLERKRDDYSFSSSAAEKTDRFSSLLSGGDKSDRFSALSSGGDKSDRFSALSSGGDKSDRFSALSSSAAEKSERVSSLSSSKGATTSATSTSNSRKVEQGVEAEVDDDKLASMMKKMPSSQEILERISKMELDD
ncbi:hypothetical protein Pmani_039759 [Petrolisthes manimaculis]|uniref:Uncharacterized protein n=1 Tax=Petrolisthes manimaculis TaxID=1843537 RepID=A0AAE1TL20_9EUCA|nr:hypothetical protein Pmani_039759 [Petrolisthes manimaculis]